MNRFYFETNFSAQDRAAINSLTYLTFVRYLGLIKSITGLPSPPGRHASIGQLLK